MEDVNEELVLDIIEVRIYIHMCNMYIITIHSLNLCMYDIYTYFINDLVHLDALFIRVVTWMYIRIVMGESKPKHV